MLLLEPLFPQVIPPALQHLCNVVNYVSFILYSLMSFRCLDVVFDKYFQELLSPRMVSPFNLNIHDLLKLKP
jgi:hypothetical protein